jgi:aminoglycoside phosphotransferase (APT) family kinase protein
MTLDAALADVGRIRRRAPYAYRTSWPLDEVEVARPDGSELRLLVKRFDAEGVLKPVAIVDPAREAEAYALLAAEDLGAPELHAAGDGWLAVEKVEGVELWQLAGIGAWTDVARWARRLHDLFSGRRLDSPPLLRHDESFYRHWFNRACQFGGPGVERLRKASEVAVARLTALPPTLIHGELYPSNVIVAGARVAAIDWEMAAIGPGVIDIAALVTGWPDPEREMLLRAYGEVDRADIAAAQLQLALQWIGWSEGWEAPREHRRDWMAEADTAAGELVR